jgi:hypothetical protein
MQHYDDVSPELEGFSVTGLLIAAITVVAVMKEAPYPQFPGHAYRLIRAGVIDQKDVIHHLPIQFRNGALKCLGRVICGQNYYYPLSVEHALSNRSLSLHRCLGTGPLPYFGLGIKGG